MQSQWVLLRSPGVTTEPSQLADRHISAGPPPPPRGSARGQIPGPISRAIPPCGPQPPAGRSVATGNGCAARRGNRSSDAPRALLPAHAGSLDDMAVPSHRGARAGLSGQRAPSPIQATARGRSTRARWCEPRVGASSGMRGSHRPGSGLVTSPVYRRRWGATSHTCTRQIGHPPAAIQATHAELARRRPARRAPVTHRDSC